MKYPNLHSTLPRRIALIAVLFAVNSGLFALLNEYPYREPTYLPTTPIDDAIPFMVWTVWPYTVLFLANVVLPFLIRDDRLFRATLFAYLVAISCNMVIWASFPTAFPRPDLPAGVTLSEQYYRWIVSIDPGTNCFPSGHVTIPAVLIWGLSRQWKKYRFWLWGAVLISSLTIITTKQHYFWDLLGGLATAGVGIAVGRWWLANKLPERRTDVDNG